MARSLFIAAPLMIAPLLTSAQASAQIKKDASVKPPAGAQIQPCTLPPDLPSTYEAAVAALTPPGTYSRFVLSKRDIPSDRPRGTILGRSVTPKGVQCVVVFDVSIGPPTTTTVPQLLGLSREDAINRLRQFDLQSNVITQDSSSPTGRVFDQRPPANTTVKRGSTVSVFVAAATLIDVPNVIGRQLGEAKTLLGRFSMQAGARASARPKGEVIDQDPQAPAQRPLGSNITVVVSDGSLTVVPQLVGRTPGQAADLLKEASLRANLVEQPSDQPVGQVFRQLEPAGRSVPRGATVTAYIAIPRPLSVPNVIGLQQSDAAARLNRFAVESSERPSMRPRGEVVDQDPRAPAQRPPDATVRIFVSDGSRVLVPNVMQVQLDAARKSVSDRDLQTGPIEQIENRAAPGVVLTQDPPPNTEVQRGSSVTLKVSTGLVVPAVEGDMIKEAREKLAAFKVSTTSIHGVEPEGRVITQNIKPPTRAAAGTPIELEVSDGSLAVVPNVGNMSLTDARRVLGDSGFLAERSAGPDFDFATVISQQPAAGGTVGRGSSVRLTLTWPPWFWLATVVAALMIIVAAWTLLARRWPPWKPRPPKPTLPVVHTAVRIDPASAEPKVTESQPNGPELRVTTRIEPGTNKIDLTDGDSR